MWESITKYLVDVAPVVLVLASWVWILQKENRENQSYMRANDQANLEVLRELKSLLAGLIEKNQKEQETLRDKLSTNKMEVLKKLEDEFIHVKEHIDNRSDLLESRLKEQYKN